TEIKIETLTQLIITIRDRIERGQQGKTVFDDDIDISNILPDLDTDIITIINNERDVITRLQRKLYYIELRLIILIKIKIKIHISSTVIYQKRYDLVTLPVDYLTPDQVTERKQVVETIRQSFI